MLDKKIEILIFEICRDANFVARIWGQDIVSACFRISQLSEVNEEARGIHSHLQGITNESTQSHNLILLC